MVGVLSVYTKLYFYTPVCPYLHFHMFPFCVLDHWEVPCLAKKAFCYCWTVHSWAAIKFPLKIFKLSCVPSIFMVVIQRILPTNLLKVKACNPQFQDPNSAAHLPSSSRCATHSCSSHWDPGCSLWPNWSQLFPTWKQQTKWRVNPDSGIWVTKFLPAQPRKYQEYTHNARLPS